MVSQVWPGALSYQSCRILNTANKTGEGNKENKTQAMRYIFKHCMKQGFKCKIVIADTYSKVNRYENIHKEMKMYVEIDVDVDINIETSLS